MGRVHERQLTQVKYAKIHSWKDLVVDSRREEEGEARKVLYIPVEVEKMGYLIQPNYNRNHVHQQQKYSRIKHRPP
jgi:hypothetical protein